MPPWFVGTQADAVRKHGPDGEPLDVETVRSIVHSIIDESMVNLAKFRDEEVAPVHVELRRQSQATAMLPQGKNGALWPRYQGMNTRGFHQALNDLLKIRTHDDPPRPDDFRRDASRDRAPNEAVGDANSTAFTTDSAGYHSAPAAEWEAKDRELERLTKKLATTEYELVTVREILVRRASTRRAADSAGTIAPNEAVSTPQVPMSAAVPLKGPSALSQVLRVAMFFVAFLLGARTLGAAKVAEVAEKRGEKRAQDARIQDAKIQLAPSRIRPALSRSLPRLRSTGRPRRHSFPRRRKPPIAGAIMATGEVIGAAAAMRTDSRWPCGGFARTWPRGLRQRYGGRTSG